MFKRGDKLEINPNFTGLLEINGLYPAGQSNYSEAHYEVMVNGYRLMLPQSILGESGVFKEISPVITPEVIEKLEAAPFPVAEIERKTKKPEVKGKKK